VHRPGVVAPHGVSELLVEPRPERISISEEISSPAKESARTGSAAAASRRSSNRCTRSSVVGSRIENSSSRPTVKSVEASKRSRALFRSMVMAGPARQG
jgi:PAB1-binding protein PBP1